MAWQDRQNLLINPEPESHPGQRPFRPAAPLPVGPQTRSKDLGDLLSRWN
jgi:hypothetical protein